MSWSEDEIHRWLARRPVPAALSGSPGHDAAVLKRIAGRVVTCVDQTIENVHFDAGTSARRVGQKAAGRVLSDLAATAAAPRALDLALSAPRDTHASWIKQAIAAVAERGAEFGAPLVAGDLALTPGPAQLTVTAIGEFPARGKPPGRDRARPGQVIVLTGPCGGSRAKRHLAIEPRVAEGRWLLERGATAMMDVSDGLALDLHRCARASGVAFELEHVPVHRDATKVAKTSGLRAEWHALHDGEDHELFATLPVRGLEKTLRDAPVHCPELRVIGRVRKGRGVRLSSELPGGPGTWTPERGGYLHGC